MIFYLEKIYVAHDHERRNEFIKNPNMYVQPKENWERALILSHQERASDKFLTLKGYDAVELMNGKLKKGQQ